MSAVDGLGEQFKTLYHFGNFGSVTGMRESLKRGLLPFSQLDPDFYDEDEWHPHHDSVWAFDTPHPDSALAGKGHQGGQQSYSMVEFRVPEADAVQEGTTAAGHGIYRVGRRVEPEEITSGMHVNVPRKPRS